MTGRARGRAGPSSPTNAAPPERGRCCPQPSAPGPRPRHGRAALAAGAAAAPLPERPGAAVPAAGWDGYRGRPRPNPGAAAGCTAWGWPPAGQLAEIPAAAAPAVPQGSHALLRQGHHQRSRDAAPVACSVSQPVPLVSREESAEVPPGSPQLVSPPPHGACGCLPRPLTASWG
ncbi:LOW QUALITY PROTEIN: uncharacterized protein VSU04_008929 [Chlamydotis macqueenii]